MRIALAAVISAFFAGVVYASPTPVDDKPKKKMTLCAHFNPSGNSKTIICSALPLKEATAACNEKLKKQGFEGTCDCTDDADFINGRCG